MILMNADVLRYIAHREGAYGVVDRTVLRVHKLSPNAGVGSVIRPDTTLSPHATNMQAAQRLAADLSLKTDRTRGPDGGYDRSTKKPAPRPPIESRPVVGKTVRYDAKDESSEQHARKGDHDGHQKTTSTHQHVLLPTRSRLTASARADPTRPASASRRYKVRSDEEEVVHGDSCCHE